MPPRLAPPQRIEQLARWIEDTYPRVYWLSGFTYPTGFLTAVLQTTARKASVPIDTLSFEFSIINLDEKEILMPPKEGVYVKGLFLEGAGWDFENGCLCEPEPMELIVPMPILLFRWAPAWVCSPLCVLCAPVRCWNTAVFPVPVRVPRAGHAASAMLPGQRTRSHRRRSLPPSETCLHPCPLHPPLLLQAC